MYLDDCVCVLPDLTWLPLLGVGRKSWYIIIIIIHLRGKCVNKETLTCVCCHWKFGWKLFLGNVKKTICIENRTFSGVWGKPTVSTPPIIGIEQKVLFHCIQQYEEYKRSLYNFINIFFEICSLFSIYDVCFSLRFFRTIKTATKNRRQVFSGKMTIFQRAFWR